VLDDQGITTPVGIGAALGMPDAEATKLLISNGAFLRGQTLDFRGGDPVQFLPRAR
jgi:hypothetical protein